MSADDPKKFSDLLPGAQGASLGKISEILRGAVIKGIVPEKAQDPFHGGEVIRIDLEGGDMLLISAAPVSELELAVGTMGLPLTARVRPTLVTSRGTRLKWEA